MASLTLPLRVLLAAAFGGVALFAALASSIIAAEDTGRQLEGRILQGLAAQARQAAERLDQEMLARWRDLRVAAELPAMRRADAPPELRRAILSQLHDSHGDYALLAFIGPDGRVVADSRRLLEGTDASARPFVREALRQPVTEEAPDAAPLAARLGQAEERLRLLNIAFPVRDAEGRPVGAVTAHLGWRWAEGVVGARREGEPEALILSRAGEVLLGPPGLLGRSLALPPPEGGRMDFPDGAGFLAAAAPTRGPRDYPGLGWTVLTRERAGAALAPVLAARREILLHGLAAAAAAAAFGWLAATWLTAPLRRLALAATRLQQDRAAPPLPRETGYAEAATLAAAFDAMLEDCRRSEAALRESEERLRLAQEAGQIGTYEWDIPRGVTRHTRGYAALHGLPEEGGGKGETWTDARASWAGRLLEEDRERLAQEVAAALAAPGSYAFEYRLRLPDGTLRWLADQGEVFADAEGRPVRALGMVRDVTARREAERALRESEARLRAMLEANPIGVLRADAEGRILDANEALLRLIGRDRTSLAEGGLRWDCLIPPERHAAAAAAIAEAGHEGRCRPHETECLRADGARVPVLAGWALLGGGERVAFILDLTERKRAEEALLRAKEELERRVEERTAALARSEAELRRIYDRTPAAFHSVDAEGRLVRVSDEWLSFLGYAEGEVLGRRPGEFMTPESRAQWEAGFARLREPPNDAVREREYRLVRRDGRTVDMLLRARPEHDAEGRFLRSYTVLVDVTARNEAEARLRQAQKLEALGRIAGGVAHDFNNLLQVVTGALRLLQTRADDPVRVRRYAQAALEAAERGASVTRRMQAFARQEALAPEPIALDAALAELRGLLGAPLGPGIALEIAVAPDLPPALADRAKLDLALCNLALNARDAMPRGGRLRIEAAAEEVTGQGQGQPDLPPGRYLRLSVRDTGTGMDEATLARATEPFFTTKEVGQGTGLGLSMAHGFAVQSGGALVIESRPGEGTTVTLWLPAASAPAAAVPSPRAGNGTLRPRHGLSVLLVEDEAAVRQVLAASLREAGLRGAEAENAAQALERLERGGPYDAVVTDHAMPGMRGAALAACLRQRGGRTAPPVLILTGDDGAPLAELPGGVPDGVSVLRKPVDPADLLVWLATVVGSSAPPLPARQA